MELSSEELEWSREEGIPLFSDPFIQKYYQGRDALIAQEDKHRSGSSVVSNPKNPRRTGLI